MGTTANYNENQRHKRISDPDGSNSGNSFRRIMNRTRLTDEDLEQLRLSIIKSHKKKHYRVLVISALLFIILGLVLYYFAF